MQYIALNGFRHSLSRYFNSRVRIINEFNWNRRNAAELAATIDKPTTVIGFSDGATAALTVANHSPWVKAVFAHSPMFRDEPIRTGASIFLFRTKGDTTPTFGATEQVFQRYRVSTERYWWLTYLFTHDPLPALPTRDFATFSMWRRKHQFHNGLRDIETFTQHQIVADPFVTWQR